MCLLTSGCPVAGSSVHLCLRKEWMSLWMLENKSWVLEPILLFGEFLLLLGTSVSLIFDAYLFFYVCVNVRLYLALYGSWKTLLLEAYVKNIQFAECFIIINNLRDTSTFMDCAFLLEEWNEHRYDKNRRIGGYRQRHWEF